MTVSVYAADGKPIAHSYVALIPTWRPLNRPLAEEIAETGISVLRVPAGKYLLVVGARGFAISSQRLIDVTAASGASLDVTLMALVTLTGSMMNHEGRPVHGGRVATVNAAFPPRLGRLSELAARHLAPDWSASTDANGNWKLAVPEGTVPLLLEASGSAAVWRAHSTSDTQALEVALSMGAVLSVSTDRVDPNVVVTLSREVAEGGEGLLGDEQPRIQARWVDTKLLAWSSLPPGTYEVLAEYPDPRLFMQSHVKLARVKLEPGAHEQVQVTLPPPRRLASKAAALFLRGASRGDFAGELETFGVDAAGNPRRIDHFVEEVIGGIVVHLSTEGVGPPLYATSADRFYSTVPDLVEAVQDPDAEPWPAATHPRADAHFSFRFVEEDLQSPANGLAVLRDCDKAARVTVPIEISNNVGQFRAAAGCDGMVLSLDPFEPIVAGRALQPGDQSLGDFVLRGAGSAEVRVVRDPSGAVVSGATVRAVSAEEATSKRSVVVKEAVTDDRGWALLSGLPSYWKLRVVAETPEGDTSDPVVIRIQPREREVIDPVAVPEPAAVVVDARIDDAFLARFPAARVVTLLVSPADPERVSEKRQENVADAAAPVRFDRLHPGRWVVTGTVSVAGTYSPFEIEDLDLKAGEERRLEATIVPNVFEGIVTSQGEGVAAKVIIKDRGRILYFATDSHGVFRAVLQGKGTYAVAAARLSNQGEIIPIGDVPFTDPTRRIEITLPVGGTVTARVRRGERPVAGVPVWKSRRDDSGRVEQLSGRAGTTNLAGEALFEELVPGIWTFSVRATEQREAAEKTVTVEAGKKISIDLELARAAAIEGLVRDLGGMPLPRARVECLSKGPSGNVDRASAETDAEGAFAIDLVIPAPPSAPCSIIGPLGTVDAFRAVPGQKASYSAPGATGVLRISDWHEYRSFDNVWLVTRDGRVISLSTVASKMGQFGVPLTIPGLVAGVWRVVRVDSVPQWLALVSGMGMSLPALAEFTLRAGTTETIHLNGIPPDRQGSDEHTLK